MTDSPVRVLLAEDAAELRLLLRVVLEEAGMAIAGEAADAVGARAAAAQPGIDAIVLDLTLPGATDELVAEVRAAAPRAGIVVYSGSSEEGVADRVRRAGADAFVGKGEPVEGVASALRTAVARHTSAP